MDFFLKDLKVTRRGGTGHVARAGSDGVASHRCLRAQVAAQNMVDSAAGPSRNLTGDAVAGWLRRAAAPRPDRSRARAPRGAEAARRSGVRQLLWHARSMVGLSEAEASASRGVR